MRTACGRELAWSAYRRDLARDLSTSVRSAADAGDIAKILFARRDAPGWYSGALPPYRGPYRRKDPSDNPRQRFASLITALMNDSLIRLGSRYKFQRKIR